MYLNLYLPVNINSNIDESGEITSSSRKEKSISDLKKKNRVNILSAISETRIKNLTPRKAKLYNLNQRYRNVISKLKYKLRQNAYKLKLLPKSIKPIF